MLPVLVPALGLLVTLAATPDSVLPCPQLVRMEAQDWIRRGRRCDPCMDNRALEWAECRRQATLETLADRPDLMAELAGMDRALVQLASVVGRLATIQSGGNADWSHQATRHVAEIEQGFAGLVKAVNDGPGALRTAETARAVAERKAALVQRLAAPGRWDFWAADARGDSAGAAARRAWAVQADRARELIEVAVPGFNQGCLMSLAIAEDMARKLLVPEDSIREVARRDSLAKLREAKRQ